MSELFAPTNADGSVYEGFLRLKDVAGRSQNEAQAGGNLAWMRICNVRPPCAGGLKAARLECSPQLQRSLAGHEQLLVQRLAGSSSLDEFLLELQDLLERASLQQHQTHQVPPSIHHFQQLVHQLEDLGWDRIQKISEDCRTLVVAQCDAGGRTHELELQLPLSFPAEPPLVRADLPLPLESLTWRDSSSSPHFTITATIAEFNKALQKYQDLWDCLEDFDRHTWVLEPLAAPPASSSVTVTGADALHRPSQVLHRIVRGGGSCCMRRISLGKHCSLTIKLDALDPCQTPQEVRFLGAPAMVGPMQSKLFSNMNLWSPLKLPRVNLEELMEFRLPEALNEGSEVAGGDGMSADCAICYAYYLPDPKRPQDPGFTPEVVCGTEACSRPFHTQCLVEWLRALSDTTVSFSTLFGKCPYCESPISVQMP